MTLRIETDRLLIREVLPEDEQGIFELDSDPEVHRYLGNKPINTIEEARQVITMLRQQYAELGIARWAVIEKSTGDFVGWTGFKFMRDQTVNGHKDYYDFGYRFIRRFWGMGYATESATAALDYGLNTLHLAPVFAMTHVDNVGSKNVLTKIGFTYVKTFAYDGEPTLRWMQGEPTTWYELPLPQHDVQTLP